MALFRIWMGGQKVVLSDQYCEILAVWSLGTRARTKILELESLDKSALYHTSNSIDIRFLQCGLSNHTI